MGQDDKTSILPTIEEMSKIIMLTPSRSIIFYNPLCDVFALNMGEILVVASFTEIKTGYRDFETKRNPVFCMLVLYIENIIRGNT